MTLTHFAIIAVCAYLFGSLSFAIIVSKVTLGKDIRNYGSGNAGLTNAYRTMGAKKTLFVLRHGGGSRFHAPLEYRTHPARHGK